jgi:hypothetical protein
MKIGSQKIGRVISALAVLVVGLATATNAPAILAHSAAATNSAQPALVSKTVLASLPAVDPAILGTCTAAIHDRYTVVGPDGQTYRTWHPQVVPIDPKNPAAGTCKFAHEHGDNPATSVANPNPPAFGYIGQMVGDLEPHEGFKVFVINQGTVNNEGGVAQNSTRLVFHQGTGGVKRFDTRTHSMMFDLVAPDGHYVHVQGMADTGSVGSICANPRQGKTVVVTTGCSITSLYEIWALAFNAGGRATINASVGVFDPITVLDPNSLPGQRPLIYTANVFSKFGTAFYGCNRESYAGPIYWYNGKGPTTFYTDAYGHLAASGLKQQVSANNTIGIRMSSIDFYQMKLRRSQCAGGLGLKN